LGFLGPGRFSTKTPFYGYWVSLDSLVKNEPFQWVTRHKRAKDFLVASSVKLEAPGGRAAVEAHAEAQDCS
jgi:hypothetical protein